MSVLSQSQFLVGSRVWSWHVIKIFFSYLLLNCYYYFLSSTQRNICLTLDHIQSKSIIISRRLLMYEEKCVFNVKSNCSIVHTKAIVRRSVKIWCDGKKQLEKWPIKVVIADFRSQLERCRTFVRKKSWKWNPIIVDNNQVFYCSSVVFGEKNIKY